MIPTPLPPDHIGGCKCAPCAIIRRNPGSSDIASLVTLYEASMAESREEIERLESENRFLSSLNAEFLMTGTRYVFSDREGPYGYRLVGAPVMRIGGDE